MSQTLAGPDCQLQARLEIEEGYRSVFEFLSDDTGSLESEAIPIKPKRALQIVNAEGDDCKSRSHADLGKGTAKTEEKGGVTITIPHRNDCVGDYFAYFCNISALGTSAISAKLPARMASANCVSVRK